MAKKIYRWSVRQIADMIDKMIWRNFDCVLVICGQRGLGKSTLAWKIAESIKFCNFNPKKDLVFKKNEVLNSVATKEKGIIFADEMINTAFNRDFYTQESKNLIKILTMNRDRNNLFICCVPNFASLDTQFKSLVKIRIDVIRRGLAIIHTANKSVYSRDRWDTALNEKIERQWLHGGIQNPRYSKLTTFRGLVKFRDLTDRQKDIYLKLKNEGRNKVILSEGVAIENEPLDEYDKIFYMILSKKFKDKDHFKEYLQMHDLEYNPIMVKMRYRFNKEGIKQSPRVFIDPEEED